MPERSKRPLLMSLRPLESGNHVLLVHRFHAMNGTGVEHGTCVLGGHRTAPTETGAAAQDRS